MHIRQLLTASFLLVMNIIIEIVQSEFNEQNFEKTIKTGTRQLDAPGQGNRKPRSTTEQNLKKRLFEDYYDKTTRPVRKEATSIEVQLSIGLHRIIDVNEKEQTLTSHVVIRQKWIDEYLTWDISDYGGVELIRMPVERIWTPDLFISNLAEEYRFNDYHTRNALVHHSGRVLWTYPAVIKTYCTLDVHYFPLDTQHCDIRFESWTHTKDDLDVVYSESFGNGVYYNSENQEWVVGYDGITAERHELKYNCCEVLFPDVTFTIHMKRGSLFHLVNLIFPCFLVFLISILGFSLTVESGQKVNLEITVLLALVLFLLKVGETIPTSDSVPILSMFVASTIVLVSLALVMAVIVTSLHDKQYTSEQCPAWVLQILAFFQPCRARSLTAMRCPATQTPLPISVPDGQPSRHSTDPAQKPNHQRILEAHDPNNRSSPKLGSDSNIKIVLNLKGGTKFGGNWTYGRYKVGTKSMKRTQTNVSNAIQEKLDQARLKAEWRMVAQFADRVFLWVFLIISLITNGTLLFKMLNRSDQVK